MAHDKQIRAAGEAWAATVRATRDAANYRTVDEQAKAARATLFATHKAHGTLSVYYHLYPPEHAKVRPAREGQTSASRKR